MNDKTIARFWRKVDRNGPVLDPKLGPCWIWFGARHRAGYGEMRIAGRIYRAHRLSWELKHGPIPDPALAVCHECDNPSCVRPDHLWLGTNAQNTEDSVRKNRRASGLSHGSRTRPEQVQRGEEHGRSKLTNADVLAIRTSVETYRTLAAIYGVHENTIWHVKSRRRWRHV